MSTLFGKKKNKRKRVTVDLAPESVTEGSTRDTGLTIPNQADDPTSTHGDNNNKKRVNETNAIHNNKMPSSSWVTFEDLGLAEPLRKTCRSMGFHRPTPVQRCMLPFLLQNDNQHVLCLASTGSGKTAAFVLPILQKLQADPYGIYCTILTPTRELAKQIHQQVLAFGANAYRVQSVLCIGGLDLVHQACQLDNRPHFCVATPGRLAELLRGPNPPNLRKLRYMVLDEADRLLANLGA